MMSSSRSSAAVALGLDEGAAEGLGDVTLAGAWRAEEERVIGSLHEAAGGQLEDEAAIPPVSEKKSPRLTCRADNALGARPGVCRGARMPGYIPSGLSGLLMRA
ncbi:hypothetical protein BHS07_18690 [Myxococcus xanthus]|uniref:Uncharacterized protein n=1 Tax=Myxococcus xanthus TaxID=34 RepID=A0AAE6KSZ7_MYXXA|nr:hypothetical protein BHS09_18010 [Myxococcus xanthus]QDE75997.1 hypothetical protein BHS08_18025 [Myxococcus xanthus]QDE83422.1 hypothetical protein BHS07_18690 [Myxococcus xanthus]QDE97548.1 hypothetical protein BHS05_17825 [Myxococcus xanthus]QDF05200.1 hypothetical protein BHS04_18620 [Myxococcus xanthus]